MTNGFNPEAWARIPFVDGPLCDGCGAPFEYDLGPGVRCADCMAKPRAFSRARAACLYDETSRGPILQLKHADRTDLAPLFARWISRSARELLDEVRNQSQAAVDAIGVQRDFWIAEADLQWVLQGGAPDSFVSLGGTGGDAPAAAAH